MSEGRDKKNQSNTKESPTESFLRDELEQERLKRQDLEDRMKALESSLATTKTEIEVAQPDGVKRVYRSEQKVHHDLFKLLPELVKKNVGYDPLKPEIRSYEHTHFYHTVDSNGRKQQYCAPQAGHIHEIEFELGEEPKIILCGPPLLSQSAKKSKNFPYDKSGRLGDRHAHKGLYLFSEQMEVRNISEEAQINMAARANEEASVNRAFAAANT